MCFNSFQFSKPAAAEALISPISAALLLHVNIVLKLLSPPRSALLRQPILQFSSGQPK